jgi:hypothetical protein
MNVECFVESRGGKVINVNEIIFDEENTESAESAENAK